MSPRSPPLPQHRVSFIHDILMINVVDMWEMLLLCFYAPSCLLIISLLANSAMIALSLLLGHLVLLASSAQLAHYLLSAHSVMFSHYPPHAHSMLSAHSLLTTDYSLFLAHICDFII